MKNNYYIFIGVGALIIGLLGGYLLTNDSRYEHMRGNFGFSRDGKEYKNEDKGEMMEGMNHSGMMTGLSERAFLEHMIPHHLEAVDTAKQVVARGENAEVKAIAESIIVAQEKDIVNMKSWYKNWYGTEYKNDNTYKPMMRDLSQLSGNSLDRAFVEDMIQHHMGALMTNQQVVPNIEHDEIKALATAIAETQSAEIITMRMLLKQL